METLTKCGRIAGSANGLKIEAHGVVVVIRRAERNDIKVNATEPRNWIIDDDGTIRQGNAGEVLGNAIERSSVTTPSGNTVESVTVHGDLTIVGDAVFVNGQRVAPSAESVNRNRNTPDKLELLVPEGYRGNLDITFSAGARLEIASWSGGELLLNGSAGSIVNIGTLAGLDSFILNGRGLGGVTVDSIQAGKITVTKQGTGDLRIGVLGSDSFQLSQSGLGKTNIASLSAQQTVIVQRGAGDIAIGEVSAEDFQLNQLGGGSTRIGDLETTSFAAVKEGGGPLTVDKLVTDSLQVSQTGMGDTTISGGSADSGRVTTEGAGNITLQGRFNSLIRRSNGTGQVRVHEPA